MLDPTQNFVKTLLDVPAGGYSASDTEFTFDDASLFPDPDTEGAFNLVIWDTSEGGASDATVREIVRVTSESAGTYTVTRAQEGTSAQSYQSGETYRVILSITDKFLEDIDAGLLRDPKSTSITNGDSPFTVSDEDIVVVDVSGGDVTINLPEISTLTTIQEKYSRTFYKTGYDYNVVDIVPGGSDTIQGMNKLGMICGEQSVELFPTSNGWVVR